MAVQCTYKCVNCDFHIMTNDHGSNCVMRGIFHKYQCKKCHEIFSLSQPLIFGKPSKEDSIILGYFWKKGTEIKVTDTCPLCNAKDSLSRWSPKDGCPQCGSQVIRDPKSPIFHTD